MTVEGTHYANPEALEAQMQTQPDKPFSMQGLETDLARLYGRGDFEQIDYQFVNVGQQQGLIVNVAEKTWGPNFLRFGLSLSSDLQGETFFNLMAGHKRVWVNSLGAAMDERGHPRQHAPLRDRVLPAAHARQSRVRFRLRARPARTRIHLQWRHARRPSTAC